MAARAEADGTIRLAAPRDEDVARAVRVLAAAGFPVYEARASADLEELFRSGGAAAAATTGTGGP
jgi:type III secretory pathway lipoprotein EscJ